MLGPAVIDTHRLCVRLRNIQRKTESLNGLRTFKYDKRGGLVISVRSATEKISLHRQGSCLNATHLTRGVFWRPAPSSLARAVRPTPSSMKKKTAPVNTRRSEQRWTLTKQIHTQQHLRSSEPTMLTNGLGPGRLVIGCVSTSTDLRKAAWPS